MIPVTTSRLPLPWSRPLFRRRPIVPPLNHCKRAIAGRCLGKPKTPNTSRLRPLVISPFTCVLDVRASLGECPAWTVAEQALYWVDINAPSLNRFDPATGRNTAMPMPESIGCYALRRDGGFVVALRNGIWFAVTGR